MTRRIYLDHNVSELLGTALGRLSHDVETAKNCGLGHATDATHLTHAAAERRILLSNDRNFLALQAAWLEWPPGWKVQPIPEHAGILLLREAEMGDADHAANLVDAHIRRYDPLTNILWRWQRPRGWFIP